MNPLKAIAGLFAKGNPVKDILDGIDSLATSAEEKSQLRQSVVTSIVQAQAKVIQAEHEHGAWLSKSWRPLVMLSFACILIYTFFFGPMFGLAVVPLPAEMWTLLQVGLGGFIGGRSVEKLVTTVSPLMSAKQEIKKLKLLAKSDN